MHRNMSDNIKVYGRRDKKLVSTLKTSAESQICWVPPTPQNLALTRQHIEKTVSRLSLLSRFSVADADHEHSVTVHERPVQVLVNFNSGESLCCSQCASSSPNCAVVSSESGETTDVVEFKLVNSQTSSDCNVESSSEVEKESVLGGDGNKEVLFNGDLNGSQICVSLDNEDKEEKHERQFNFVASQSSECDVERKSADVEKQSVLSTTQKNDDTLFKEESNDFNGSQTWVSLDDQEKEEKHQDNRINNPSEKGFAAESSPFLEHNVKKRSNSLDKKRPRKRAKIKKIRPKVAFEGTTVKTPQKKPKSVQRKTVSDKNPSETRQKSKNVRKVKSKSKKKGKGDKESAGGDAHNNAVLMDENQNHCSTVVSSSGASSTMRSIITDSNGCQFDLQGHERDLRIVPCINSEGTDNVSFEYREKRGTESAAGHGENAMIMDKNLNNFSSIMNASAVSGTVTDSTGGRYNLRSCQRDLYVDLLINYEAVDHFLFKYRKKKRLKRRRKLHCFFGLQPFSCVTKRRSKRPTQRVQLASCAVIPEGDQMLNAGVQKTECKPELDYSKRVTKSRSKWPTRRFQLASCAVIPEGDQMLNAGVEETEAELDYSKHVTKSRSKLPTRRVKLPSYAVIPEGDEMLNAGVEQTKLKPELVYSKHVTKKGSKWLTRMVELSSCAVIPESDQMLNVGAEPTELKSELAYCPQISNGDQMIDVGSDQSLLDIHVDYDYFCSTKSLIDPAEQTLNVGMGGFFPAQHVHEEGTGHFPKKPRLSEDANKETFGFELVDFLGSTVASEDNTEKICRINEENGEVMVFVGRVVASEDRAETIYRIKEENREVNSTDCSLQLGLGPAPASWNCEANTMGQECLQATQSTLAFELTPVPVNYKPIGKSTGLNEVCHEPKTPLKINKKNALVPYKGSRKKLSENSNDRAIVPATNKRRFLPKVHLDEESLRMWELTVRIDNGLGSEEEYNVDPKLQEEINVFQGRIESFTSKMHIVLGDRRFKEWKGSVVDSVVGVFLTQNVSDTLSSSAYMSLAAKYPVQSSSNQGQLDENLKGKLIHGSQYYVTMPEAELNHELENKLENPIDALVEIFSKFSPYSSDRKRENNSGIIEESSFSSITHNIGKKHLYEDERVLNIFATQPENGNEKTTLIGKKKRDKIKNEEDWDSFRRTYERPRTNDQRDSVDWEAVRIAEHFEVASAIKCRGQHTILAEKIQEFLNRTCELHNSINLEWLRYAPPHIVKKYLLEINGVGLKSTECIRLLSLQHIAFPVDTNVGRIAVRLGWVPLKSLPGNLELHLLSDYPPMDDIQKYLWPRLRKLGQRNLYELHYHMITFGKVFCTKKNPNCNACPMRAECRHFASAFASANFRLPAPSNEGKGRSEIPCLFIGGRDMHRNCAAVAQPTSVSLVEPETISTSDPRSYCCQPIIEEPQSPPQVGQDIEDFVRHYVVDCDDEVIPTIKLSSRDFNANVQSFFDKFHNSDANDMSRAIVPVSVEAASIPAQKQKHITRLRTEHQVYEIPDNHKLLEGLDKRDIDDPVPYLLAIWTPGETANSCELPTKICNSQGSEKLCDDSTCMFCETIREEKADIVRGTFLIPCRTALKAKFPLNGTYFQVNEVFADYETSHKPINIPRRLIWNLRRRTVLVGTSTSSIFNGVLSLKKIQENFWRGYVCVRGMDRKTGAPKPLSTRFHCPPSQIAKTKKQSDQKNM